MSNLLSVEQRARLATADQSDGSRTIIQFEQSRDVTPSATLRLRATPVDRPRIRWAENVVDNEGMGRKSSKVCCIYHKAQDGSEDDSDSDSSESSDGSDLEPDLSRAQKAGGGKQPRKQRNSSANDGHHNHQSGHSEGRRPSPNAYERVAKTRSKRSS